MTRDEALYRVKGYLTDIIPVENYSEVEEIFKALKPKPCEDCISREDAIDALNEYFERIGKLKRRGLTKGEKAISLDTVGTIKTLPSAEPTLRERALMLLLNWAVECDFGYDNFPEEYERYKDEIEDMNYFDGMIYIAEKEVERI